MSNMSFVGTKFGRYTVTALDTESPSKPKRVICRCDCGTIKSVVLDNLKRGLSKSCGCNAREINSEKRTIDRSDGIYGRLTVIKRVENKGEQVCWLCVCVCGNRIEVPGSRLSNGNTQSCGCLQRSRASETNSTHGKTDTKEYRIWCAMKTRCSNANRDNYQHYGGRGITICDRWINSFEAFSNDMGPVPSDTHTIERKNTNGNYEPGNCRWATMKEQARNRRTSKLVTYRGKTSSLAELAEIVNVDYDLLQARLAKGWTIDDAITRPKYSRL